VVESYWSLTLQKTRLSSKGQIILPKNIREARAWESGMEFTVEPAEDGVLLRPAALFPPTEIGEVAGCLASRRKAAKSDQTRKAIDSEVRRRHDRGRY
jgi:AbrB family looped-hinge helix DNA binding protein